MSGSMIEVAQPGLLTTVQDLGRWGYQGYGVPVCGALDPVSLRIANILVGNHESLAGLEMTGVGPNLRFTEDSVIAVTGADLGPQIDSKPVPSWESVRVPSGSTLSFGGPLDGLRAYLAVAGGIDVLPVMDSRSTDLKSGFGGLNGRALQAGDSLPIGPSSILGKWSSRILPTSISRQPTYGQTFEIRVVMGPQDGMFTERGIAVLLTSEYTVSTDSDRTGCRLEGPAVGHVRGPDIVSDGSALGSIQVPGSGTPIVLLADRGTTGGYTKVATVISPDIGLLAQAMPGAKVRFSAVSVEEAHEILREQEDMIREIKAAVGLDLAGAISVRAEGVEVPVQDAERRPITVPGIRASETTSRTVSATVDGQRYEFEIEVGVP